MMQIIGQHTNDELERSPVIGWVDLRSSGTTGFGIWGLLLSSVEGAGIVPWPCKAWDKLCNFPRSNCAEDMPKAGADTDAGTGLCGIELAVRGGGSTPSARDSIDDKAVEEDNVARKPDIFNGAEDVDV